VWGRGGCVAACLALSLACKTGARPGLEECRQAARARRADAPALCVPLYVTTHDPVAGAYAARSLASTGGPTREIEAIARAVGDQPGGAEAWNALGDDRRVANDDAAAIAAYKRALEHRAPDDLRDSRHDFLEARRGAICCRGWRPRVA
jgi:hypothetical protein